MKTINNIVVFYDDELLLALLKGYCYANNITMTVAQFNVESVIGIERLKPVLVFAPLCLLISESTQTEANLLKLASFSSQVNICGLNTHATEILVQLPEWINVIINNPFDIGEIDNYIKKTFLISNVSAEERRRRERRSFRERRRVDLDSAFGDGNDGEHKESKNANIPQESGNASLKNFQLDHRNKCVFLNGHKVELTRKEYELFELLSTDANRVFLAEEIISHLWPENHRATKSDLYQYMHLLRKKVETDPNNPQWIMTIKGFGYRLNIDTHEEISQEVVCL